MKPLGKRAYGSIPHLPGSRLGIGDHHISEGQSKIVTEKKRDHKDIIIIQEKLDGSNVSIAKINGAIVPLTRAGYIAYTSPYEQHHLFYNWVLERKQYFENILNEGERLCGEWIAQACGTIYKNVTTPFIAFDLIRMDNKRSCYSELHALSNEFGFPIAYTFHIGNPLSINDAMEKCGEFGNHGATEKIEGIVYRCERNGEVDFVCKYVRPDKIDGKYLPEYSGKIIWNWKP